MSNDPPSNALTNPIEDAERIRLKRLAKLGGSAGPGRSTTPLESQSTTPKVESATSRKPAQSRVFSTAVVTPPAPKPVAAAAKPKPIEPTKLDWRSWEEECIENVFSVTIDREKAQARDWNLVWLKSLRQDLDAERPGNTHLGTEDVDRVLITRLEISPEMMSDDLDYLPVLASLPAGQTVLEYLVGCWKRFTVIQKSFAKKPHLMEDITHAHEMFTKLKDLITGYIGLTIQEPEMFPQPSKKVLGALELLPSLLQLGTYTSPLANDPAGDPALGIRLDVNELDGLFEDLCTRFEGTDEGSDGLDEIIELIAKQLLFNQMLADPKGLLSASASSDGGWRGVLAALEFLSSKRAIAPSLVRMNEWLPIAEAGFTVGNANEIERRTLMGPLVRMGVFDREWPQVARMYFDNAQGRTATDIIAANNTLRSALNNLQHGLFTVFNSCVVSGPKTRSRVLQYFGNVISFNVKRGGSHVDYKLVSSDCFIMNLQAVLLQFCEKFMDATYSKVSRVDPTYLAKHGDAAAGSRVNLSEETRLNATLQENTRWSQDLRAGGSSELANFITEIFYLTAAMHHFGFVRIIQFEQHLTRAIDDRQSAIDRINSDQTWQGTPMQARVQAEIDKLKKDIDRAHSQIFAFQAQLLDPELTQRVLLFCSFMITFLIRLVDPAKQHPTRTIELPLPKEVPTAFSMLPEFFIEDMADYYLYLIRHAPHLMDYTTQVEIMNLCMTFLSSTWYIKNPFLKSKMVQIMFLGTLGWNRDKTGVLNNQLNAHPLSLKHLMAALTGFYIEIEATGSHTQFYDKFNARRDIAYILNAVWHNPQHRESLRVLSQDLNKFTRFVNLMMNDVTFLLDESLSKLSEIGKVEREMREPDWSSRPPQERQEAISRHHAAGSQATSWMSLTKSTLDLLQKFTAETKEPFMTPEIVDRLAAMLDYNLEAIVGPKSRDLKVQDMEKYKFNPKQLLSEILQIFLNLCQEKEFVHAVANDERSYKQSLFDKAFNIANAAGLKSGEELEQLSLFVHQVEAVKASLIEEDFGEIPDEFTDPIMATLMRDPVILPSSKTVLDRATIKAHLLSDTKDPFNREPLDINDIVPATELKRRIDQFIADHRARRRQERGANDVMQVDS